MVFLLPVVFCFFWARVCWLLFSSSLVALSFCLLPRLVLLFECLGFARAFPSRAHSPCRFLGLPLEFRSPSGSLRAGTPTNQPYGIPTPHRALSVGLPLSRGSATVVSLTLACEGGCLGVGGWALEGRGTGMGI